METPVIIVGAGLAGLTCAVELARRGVRAQIIEASDGVGGRVRTDEVGGFLLDRGFQVFLTGYPTPRHYLDFEALALRPMSHGALIRTGTRGFERVADPLRAPHRAIETALSFVGTLPDKLKVLKLATALRDKTIDQIWRGEEMSTLEYLLRWGFSDRFILEFFIPFYGGVFLDPSLEVSSKMFELTFKLFAQGDAAVPARGMGEIPRQLAAQLDPAQIRLNTRVAKVEAGAVVLDGGERLEAERVVVATDARWAAEHLEGVEPYQWNSTTCLYYAADRAPIREPMLALNGTGHGVVNSLIVMSEVSEAYAPYGQELISVSLVGRTALGDEELDELVRDEIGPWFGPEVAAWTFLRAYRIPYAQPHQGAGRLRHPREVFRTARLSEQLYVCGDHRETASIEGAFSSGARAAQQVHASMR